jgi:hypothetical protein
MRRVLKVIGLVVFGAVLSAAGFVGWYRWGRSTAPTSTHIAAPTTSTTTTPLPEVAKCLQPGPPEIRPVHLLMACGNDQNPQIKVVLWTTWTRTGAIGTGIVTLNTCNPACVDNNDITYSATITLSDPRFTKVAILPIFQDLTISPTGPQGQLETGSQPGSDWGYFNQ